MLDYNLWFKFMHNIRARGTYIVWCVLIMCATNVVVRYDLCTIVGIPYPLHVELLLLIKGANHSEYRRCENILLLQDTHIFSSA